MSVEDAKLLRQESDNSVDEKEEKSSFNRSSKRSSIRSVEDDGHSLKYTPIRSINPPDFVEKKEYGLRYNKHIRIFLVITMYNEGPDELDRTLKGVCKNVQYLCDKTGISDFWKEVVVCIVSDGRTTANENTLNYLTANGACSVDLMKQELEEFPDEASVHLFEATVKFKVAETGTDYYPPLQMMFALKEKNAGKINSHWWFYVAFATVMNPDYCFLLDVGTTPKHPAFLHMWRAMEMNERVAGVAGEITTLDSYNLSNPLVAAQQFEYKISSIFDKAMESMFGYITVLPGAFSAYRWSALSGEPLNMYFHHLTTKLQDQEPFTANMYLAEDRILCYELVAKKKCNYILAYVHDAVATTDVPTSLSALIKQRRRWLNGSLFALIYAIFGWKKLMEHSAHSFLRKAVLSFQFFYYIVMVLLQWTSVANYYLTFFFLVKNFDVPYLFTILRYLFLALILVQFVLGLGNKPDRVDRAYFICSILYGLFTIAIYAISLYEIITGGLGYLVLLALIASFGSMFVVGVLFFSLRELVISFFQYTFFTATYVIMFPVYSLCNTHDISWGTKNLDESKIGASAELFIKGKIDSEKMRAKLKLANEDPKKEKQLRDKVQSSFESFRSYLLLVWMLTNGLYVSILTGFESTSSVVSGYLKVIFILVLLVIFMRSIGAIAYIVVTYLQKLSPAPVPRYPSVKRGDQYP